MGTPGHFREGLSIDVVGLGPTRFCHGSPRSDEECVTEKTPEERVLAFAEGVPERVIVHGHTHVHYEGTVVDAAAERILASGDPFAPELVEMLRNAPTRAEAIERAETLVFAG